MKILCNSIEEAIHFQALYGKGVVLAEHVDGRDIADYNKLVPSHEQLRKYDRECDIIWNIPDTIRDLTYEQVLDILIIRHESVLEGKSELERGLRNRRLEMEFNEFFERDLLFLLQLMIYVINEFERQGICWGVGRGSSVASYILYILGVHDIDSYHYKLDMKDFFK